MTLTALDVYERLGQCGRLQHSSVEHLSQQVLAHPVYVMDGDNWVGLLVVGTDYDVWVSLGNPHHPPSWQAFLTLGLRLVDMDEFMQLKKALDADQ